MTCSSNVRELVRALAIHSLKSPILFFVENSKCLTKHKVMFVCVLEITETCLNADVVIFIAVKPMNYE